jgi:hypothetical protein
MLMLSKSLVNQPVMSLRSGTQIAVAVEPIINPHNLKVMGWWCKGLGGQTLVLLSDDVRDTMPNGLAVNEGLFIQKLYVARPLHKVFTSEDTLIIDRTQILEVTDHYILVRDTEVKATAEELAGAMAA